MFRDEETREEKDLRFAASKVINKLAKSLFKYQDTLKNQMKEAESPAEKKWAEKKYSEMLSLSRLAVNANDTISENGLSRGPKMVKNIFTAIKLIRSITPATGLPEDARYYGQLATGLLKKYLKFKQGPISTPYGKITFK